MHLDDRQTVADLKREAVKRVGVFYREMGIPQRLERVRLSGVSWVFIFSFAITTPNYYSSNGSTGKLSTIVTAYSILVLA